MTPKYDDKLTIGIDQFFLRNFWDDNHKCSGIEIYDEYNTYLGELLGMSTECEDEDEKQRSYRRLHTYINEKFRMIK